MSVPGTLLELELTLRPGDEVDRRGHIAHLAGRLGFRTVWMPVDDPSALEPASLRDLADRARPARIGWIVGGDPATLPARLGDLEALADATPLLELHAPAGSRGELIDRIGPDRWRDRAILPWYDPQAFGQVILAERFGDRPAVHRALAGAVEAAGEAGRPVRRTVALTVSIGRTTAEARARAQRDPDLRGHRHPATTGLFGTLEQAQEQAVDLARAGADALRVVIADEHDVADALAQLRAVAVGPTAVLHARAR